MGILGKMCYLGRFMLGFGITCVVQSKNSLLPSWPKQELQIVILPKFYFSHFFAIQLHMSPNAHDLWHSRHKICTDYENTGAMTALPIRIEPPAGVTGALDCGFELLTPLAALQVSGAVVHHFTGLIVWSQVETSGAGTDHPSAGSNTTLMTAASICL